MNARHVTIVWPPRRVIVRLDPDLDDSPLRRALYDANLTGPIGEPAADHTDQETRIP